MKEIDKIKSWLGSGSINIFGLPFSGKDTQAERLAKLLDGKIVSSGAVLRSQKDDPDLQASLAAGNIVPSSIFEKIVVPYLEQDQFDSKPLILSSVGRKHGEEDGVRKVLEKTNHPLKAVVFLSLDELTARKRLEASFELADRGERADDSREAIENRFHQFEEMTMPVIDYYRHKGLLVEVDGEPSRDEVTKLLFEALANFIEKNP